MHEKEKKGKFLKCQYSQVIDVWRSNFTKHVVNVSNDKIVKRVVWSPKITIFHVMVVVMVGRTYERRRRG